MQVLTYCYIHKVKRGYSVSIVATIDGVKPEFDEDLTIWAGSKNELVTFLNAMFTNAIIREN